MGLDAVVIQAGGTGARLGGASKSDYVVAGRRLLDIFFDELAGIGFTGRSVVIAPAEVEVPSGAIRTLEDPPHGGPLAGVAAGIAALADLPDSALVGLGTCDAPLAPRLFPDLLAHLVDDGAVPLTSHGWINYLHGAYRLGALRSLTFERDGAVRVAFGDLDVARIADAQTWCMDVDTPEDAAELALRLARDA